MSDGEFLRRFFFLIVVAELGLRRGDSVRADEGSNSLLSEVGRRE